MDHHLFQLTTHPKIADGHLTFLHESWLFIHLLRFLVSHFNQFVELHLLSQSVNMHHLNQEYSSNLNNTYRICTQLLATACVPATQ